MRLFICRHGQTEANASGLLLGRANPELNDTGRAQAQQIAEALPALSLVVTSPLQRCRQTAEFVVASQKSKPDLVVDDRLLELDYGELDLTPLAKVPAATWESWRSDDDFRPEGGESLRELSIRVGELLDELIERPESALGDPALGDITQPIGDIAVVTHVSPIKASLAWTLQVPIGISWNCFVEQASITTIDRGRFGPVLRRFNDVSHL